MKYIKNINVSMVLLVLMSARMLMTDSTIAQSLFGLGLIACFAYNSYVESRKVKPLDEEVKKELASIKSTISGLAIKGGMKPPMDPNQRVW